MDPHINNNNTGFDILLAAVDTTTTSAATSTLQQQQQQQQQQQLHIHQQQQQLFMQQQQQQRQLHQHQQFNASSVRTTQVSAPAVTSTTTSSSIAPTPNNSLFQQQQPLMAAFSVTPQDLASQLGMAGVGGNSNNLFQLSNTFLPMAPQQHHHHQQQHNHMQSHVLHQHQQPRPTLLQPAPPSGFEKLFNLTPVHNHNNLRALIQQLQNQNISNTDFVRMFQTLNAPTQSSIMNSSGGPSNVIDALSNSNRKRPVDSSPPSNNPAFNPSSSSKRIKQGPGTTIPLFPNGGGAPTIVAKMGVSVSVSNSNIGGGAPSQSISKAAPQNKSGNEDDNFSKFDVDTMLDASNYANLKEEEEMMSAESSIARRLQHQRQVSNGYTPGVNRVKVQDLMNMNILKNIVEGAASSLNIPEIEEDALVYIALAAQDRIRSLVQSMIVACKHRTGLVHQELVQMERIELSRSAEVQDLADASGVKIELGVNLLRDLKQEIVSIEALEKSMEKEIRAERGYASVAAGGEEGEEGDGEGGGLGALVHDDPKAKKKKKSAKAAERDVSDTVKARLVNTVALRAVGGLTKSWMLPSGSASISDKTRLGPAPKKKADAAAAGRNSNEHGVGDEGTAARAGRASIGGVIDYSKPLTLESDMDEKVMRPMTQKEMRKISLRDALYSMEQDVSTCNSKIVQKYQLL